MRAQSARGGSPLRFYSHEAPFITEGTRYDEGPARCAPTEVDKARGGSRIALLVTLEAFSRERLERLGMITSLLHEHVDVRGSLSTTCT